MFRVGFSTKYILLTIITCLISSIVVIVVLRISEAARISLMRAITNVLAHMFVSEAMMRKQKGLLNGYLKRLLSFQDDLYLGTEAMQLKILPTETSSVLKFIVANCNVNTVANETHKYSKSTTINFEEEYQKLSARKYQI